jgi:MYXO-CTERM domain-containing protein
MKRSLDIAAVVLTALLLLGFAVLSLRGVIDPQQASARFGAQVADSAGALFYRVYLSRNLVIVVTGALLLLMRQWTPLAILLTVTAALPIFDMAVLSHSGVTPPVFHPAALALLVLAAGLLWRRAVIVSKEKS